VEADREKHKRKNGKERWRNPALNAGKIWTHGKNESCKPRAILKRRKSGKSGVPIETHQVKKRMIISNRIGGGGGGRKLFLKKAMRPEKSRGKNGWGFADPPGEKSSRRYVMHIFREKGGGWIGNPEH